jgi:hypothetical protein
MIESSFTGGVIRADCFGGGVKNPALMAGLANQVRELGCGCGLREFDSLGSQGSGGVFMLAFETWNRRPSMFRRQRGPGAACWESVVSNGYCWWVVFGAGRPKRRASTATAPTSDSLCPSTLHCCGINVGGHNRWLGSCAPVGTGLRFRADPHSGGNVVFRRAGGAELVAEVEQVIERDGTRRWWSPDAEKFRRFALSITGKEKGRRQNAANACLLLAEATACVAKNGN